ncbi:MAG: FkbM family methyltransferase [Desulfomicrobium sp.]|nr:FkbM family methyltransferase [Desulfomicrobium sp.]
MPALRALSLAPCNLPLAASNSSLEPCALQLETVPYDEHLLERSCTQWQFGDWQSLAKISRQTLQHHPDRGKLALFTAAGLLQTDEHERAKEFVRLALNWGVTKKQVCQILVAGVHNSLGRVAALGGQEERAYQHFERAVGAGFPGSDKELISQARMDLQYNQLEHNVCKFLEARTEERKWLTAKAKNKDQTLTNKSALQLQIKISNNDDNIDDFIEDLSLYFHGRFIDYVDVGANVGSVFKKLNESRKIKIREAHLYEPDPKNYTELAKKVEGLQSKHAHNLAVGKEIGKLWLMSSGTMTKVVSLDEYNGVGDVFEVDAVTLDSQESLFTDGRINLLKIDVEGFEKEVLEGAKGLLNTQSVDVLYLEVGFNKDGKQQTYFVEIDTFLQAFGYRVFKIYEQKNEWISDLPILRRCNFAYMSQRFAEANPASVVQRMRELERELDGTNSMHLKN